MLSSLPLEFPHSQQTVADQTAIAFLELPQRAEGTLGLQASLYSRVIPNIPISTPST